MCPFQRNHAVLLKFHEAHGWQLYVYVLNAHIWLINTHLITVPHATCHGWKKKINVSTVKWRSFNHSTGTEKSKPANKWQDGIFLPSNCELNLSIPPAAIVGTTIPVHVDFWQITATQFEDRASCKFHMLYPILKWVAGTRLNHDDIIKWKHSPC